MVHTVPGVLVDEVMVRLDMPSKNKYPSRRQCVFSNCLSANSLSVLYTVARGTRRGAPAHLEPTSSAKGSAVMISTLAATAKWLRDQLDALFRRREI